MNLSPKQMRLAADICEARKFSMTAGSTDDEVAAGAWVWDNGIFFMGAEGCDVAAKMLREKAAQQEASV